jgi:translation initiation factor 2-alpha kinase 4
MDQSGGLVSLPYDLTVPFARHVARQNITQLKRFTISRVYRQTVMGGQPLQLYECDFDIISPSVLNLIPDAEVIRAVFEILEELPFVKSEGYEIHLSHAHLIEGLFDYAGVPSEMRRTAASSLLQLRRLTWPRVRHQLLTQAKLSHDMVNAIGAFAPMSGSLETVAAKLKPLLSKSSMASTAMKELRTIIDHLKAFDVKAKIMVDPSLAYNIHYYSGMIFQIVLNVQKKFDIIAAGGRYDKLISTFRHPALATQPMIHGVGVNIAIEKITSHVLAYEAEMVSTKAFKNCDTDVYICSFGKSLLIECMQIAAMLWSAGIKVSFFCYDRSLSSTLLSPSS